ncbi:MAG: hypothetical protein RR060_03965 [Victivallaceae bacterium]
MIFFNSHPGKKILLTICGLFVSCYTVFAANTLTEQKPDTEKNPELKLEYKLTIEQKTQFYFGFEFRGNEPSFTPLTPGSYIIQISVINNKIFFELYDMDENAISRLPGVAINSNTVLKRDLSGNTTLRLNQTLQLFHTQSPQMPFNITLKAL